MIKGQCGRSDCNITELHTHKLASDGIIGQVCQHGSLARSCYTCELEVAIQHMQRALKSICSHSVSPDCDFECCDNLREVARHALEDQPKQNDR